MLSSRWWSAAAFLAPFALFCISLAPDVAYWDTAEMQTVPYIFGIAHPTGFPTFVAAGWLFSHLVPIGTIAHRLSLMSALAMAAAAWMAYATAVELGEEAPVASAAALLFAVGEIVWTRGTRAEVHAFAVAFSALVIWQAVRFARTGAPRALQWSALGYGLALATHGIATLLAPGLVLLLAPRVRDVSLKTAGTACALFVAPLVLYAYIPIRSAQLFAARVDPTLALGLPPGRPYWDFAHPATWHEFVSYMLGGEGSQVGTGFSRMFIAASYPDVGSRFAQTTLHEMGPVTIFFALLGVALLLRRHALIAIALVVACGVCVPYGLLYPEADQDRYLMTAFWGIAVFAAYGAGHAFKAYFNREDAVPQAVATALLYAGFFGLLWTNRAIVDQRNDPGARTFIQRVVAATPNDAVLVVNWTYATPLGYAAYVDHTLGGRIVVTAFPGDYSAYYPSWLKTRRIYLVNQPAWQDATLHQVVITNDPGIMELRAP